MNVIDLSIGGADRACGHGTPCRTQRVWLHRNVPLCDPLRRSGMTVSSLVRALSVALIAFVLPPAAHAQATYDTTAFAALKWREVGPYRGGRSVAVTGSARKRQLDRQP